MKNLDTVKNLDTIFPVSVSVNGKEVNPLEVVKCAMKDNDYSMFVSFDIVKGTCKIKAFDFRMAHIQILPFANNAKLYWYYLVNQKIESDYSDFSGYSEISENSETIKALSEDEKKALEIVKARYDKAKSIVSTYDANAISNVPAMVRTLVKALFGVKANEYAETIRDAATDCLNTCKNAKAAESKGTFAFNVKDIREKVDTLCKAVYVANEGISDEYTFHANNNLAMRVKAVSYNGLTVNGKGIIVLKNNDIRTIISEIVLECFRLLQEKYANAHKEERKEEKKEEKKA